MVYSPMPLVSFPTCSSKGITFSLHSSASTCWASASNVSGSRTSCTLRDLGDIAVFLYCGPDILDWGVRQESYTSERSTPSRALLREQERESQRERCGNLLTKRRPVQSFK